MILILAAMPEELAALVTRLGLTDGGMFAGFPAYRGKFAGERVLAGIAGIGKANSAATLSYYLAKHPEITLVVNVGVAGGLGELSPQELFYGTKLYYGDVDCTYFGYSYGQIPREAAFFEIAPRYAQVLTVQGIKGIPLITNDRFLTGPWQGANMKFLTGVTAPAVAFDMESAALAQVARRFGKDFIALRAISDILGRAEQYAETVDAAAERLAAACALFLENNSLQK